jgi:hypothetical protein
MDEAPRLMSYGLAVQMADEWEFKAREYRKTHPRAVTEGLFMMIRGELDKASTVPDSAWTNTDVAGKACEILAERLGETKWQRKAKSSLDWTRSRTGNTKTIGL